MKMDKSKKTQAGSKSPPEGASPEFLVFEKLAKKVIQTPKAEIDLREAEYQKQRKRRKGQP